MLPSACNPNTQETEAGGSQVWGQPGVYVNESQANLDWANNESLSQKRKEKEKESLV